MSLVPAHANVARGAPDAAQSGANRQDPFGPSAATFSVAHVLRVPLPAGEPVVKPFRWDRLPKLLRREAHLVSAAAAHAARLRPGTEAWRQMETALGVSLNLRLGPVTIIARRELKARLDSGALWVAVCVRDPAGNGFAVVVDGALAGRMTARVFGAPEDELPAPRAPTSTEKGVLSYLVAAALDARGLEGWIVCGVVTAPARLLPLFTTEWVLSCDAHVALGGAGGYSPLRLWFPESLLRQPSGSLGPMWPVCAPRLDHASVRARVVAGPWRLGAGDIAQLSPRDVVLLPRVGPDAQALRLCVGRGGFASTLDLPACTLTIQHSYQQGDPMASVPDESLAGDLPVELTCQIAELRLSAREVCELGPGAVIPLGRPVGSTVALCAGGKLIARGELVDVEGELGVRVLEVG